MKHQTLFVVPAEEFKAMIKPGVTFLYRSGVERLHNEIYSFYLLVSNDSQAGEWAQHNRLSQPSLRVTVLAENGRTLEGSIVLSQVDTIFKNGRAYKKDTG
jgi:hypothetical protein